MNTAATTQPRSIHSQRHVSGDFRRTFRNSSKEQILSEVTIEGVERGPIEQNLIPALAKKPEVLKRISRALPLLPTFHDFHNGNSVTYPFPEDGSVHLVVTSPPYWTLKDYNDGDGQLGHVEDYSKFVKFLEAIWIKCLNTLTPGGRLVVVVGDVCLPRRKNNGRHSVIPLHASIQESCRKIGFDNLTPIFWHKISNANFESGGGSILGKPYEPNCVIKNDVEYILMFRKPGGYRSPGPLERQFSVISEKNHREWFSQIWSGVTGASTRNHPAPYPEQLVQRLIRMFSFVGDTVFDPFLGTGTTSVAACRSGRNSVGIEVDPEYFRMAVRRFRDEFDTLLSIHEIVEHVANPSDDRT